MAKIRLKDLDEVLDNFEEAGLIEEVRYKGERFTRKTLPYERKNGRFENFIVTNIEFNQFVPIITVMEDIDGEMVIIDKEEKC